VNPNLKPPYLHLNIEEVAVLISFIFTTVSTVISFYGNFSPSATTRVSPSNIEAVLSLLR
jgi:hypothetical protein